MGKIVRCITVDGSVACMATDSTDIVSEMERIHKTSAVNTAALGRLLTGASLMGDMLKNRDDSLTLRLSGSGPAGQLVAVSDSSGNVRGYIENPVVEIPLNSKGKLDVAGTVGRDGYLTVIKDMGMKEPYVGQVPIVSGEIAEDITSYYAVSEQIPTVCALGVLVNPDLTVKAAGGFLINVLPFADDSVLDKLEKAIEGLEPVTQMLTNGLTPEEICRHVMKGFELDILDESDTSYKCTCSRERMERALISLGKKELEELSEDPETEISCDFCKSSYKFTSSQIKDLAKQATKE